MVESDVNIFDGEMAKGRCLFATWFAGCSIWDLPFDERRTFRAEHERVLKKIWGRSFEAAERGAKKWLQAEEERKSTGSDKRAA